MPAPIDEHWENRVKSIKANNLKWGAVRIHKELVIEAQAAGRTDQPSERWVGDFLSKKWSSLTKEEKAEYREFYWPESMVLEELPWEASGPGLELLAFLDSRELYMARPPVRLVKWFYRVTKASPDESLLKRAAIAGNLAYNELAGHPDKVRSWEWCLAYSKLGVDREERKRLYVKALTRDTAPLPWPRFRLHEKGQEPGEEVEDRADEALLYVIFLGLTVHEARKRRRYEQGS